ncbi:OmpG family monomeric porin [Vibrio sp. SCSIO 43136]|uniref:OmpG family monomeric porin n=1 Tax=Vibrio sp. SCSIO 43136 TaxID=2819101 RepID=UPI00207649A0|nr:OmpG family monomeric porin [Vibrio sp. SCSIO 43136]USD67930.1 OmpG family monomeric porin [Vibrio sp. SCSIO 43136]
MKKITLTTLVAAMAAATTAQAAYIESGVEHEFYNSEFRAENDNVLPYLAAGFNPVADLPLTVGFKHSDKQMVNDQAAVNAGKADRARQEYMVTYKHSFNDAFTVAPMFAIRHDNNELSIGKKGHATEYRFHPNMSYQLDDTFALALDGFIAPVKIVDSVNAKNTSALKSELDFRLNVALNDTQSARVSFYNEAAKADGQDKGNNEWQLRAMFTQKFGDLTVTPFVRYDLSRDLENTNKATESKLRHRAGITGSYKLQDNLAVVFEGNYQAEQENQKGDFNKARVFTKVGLNYSF